MRELDEHTWAKQETNAPLRHIDQVQIAKLFGSVRQLPMHVDRWKNWDNMLAIHHCLRTTGKCDHVLDAGACRDPLFPSAFLPGLKKLGFARLYGCNLDEPAGDPQLHDGICYSHQDITKTDWSQHFDFIACLSVIEHGVDFRKYFAEMSRILVPGGHLFTSFDYWPTPVDTHGMMAFGAPIRIFTKEDVMQMVIFANGMGLDVVTQPVLETTKPIVNWMGLDYTFFNLLMRKTTRLLN